MALLAQERQKTDESKVRGEKKWRLYSKVVGYSLHLQKPSSARSLLRLEGGTVTWRGKMGAKQPIWNSFEAEL